MGIWLIYYGIDSSNRDRYLDWFEAQHIDEKLDRPGYDWAAHYSVTAGGSGDQGDTAYVAMFGAATSRVFFDPSPAQIKPHQDDLTREMIGYRIAPISLIVTEEWDLDDVADDSSNAQPPNRDVSANLIRLGIFSHSADEQAIGAWCAQEHFPAVAQVQSSVSARKLLSSAGSPRHLVLEEYNAESEAAEIDFGEMLPPYDHKLLSCPPVTARCRIAKRSD